MSNGIFGLTARHADWLALRRTVVAGNIANANTPEYKAREISAFSEVLEGASAMSRSHPRHVGDAPPVRTVSIDDAASPNVHHSGNAVSLEQEMMSAGEVSRQHSMNVAIVRSFHRMYLNSIKG